MNLENVYFVIGTSYAGKSTIVKNLAKKHNGIALEENYHDEKLPELDSKEYYRVDTQKIFGKDFCQSGDRVVAKAQGYLSTLS